MIPRLTTARLVLDAFTPEDVPAVVELAGHADIAATTQNVPHPFSAEDAQKWMAGHLSNFSQGTDVVFAIRRNGKLVGMIGFHVVRQHDRAEMGFWTGRPFWNQGFATEAARAAVAFAFQHFQLERVEAHHFGGNDASGRVMAKIGMAKEGFHPCSRKKNGVYLDRITYGLTRAMAEAAGLFDDTKASVAAPAASPATPDGITADGTPAAHSLVAPGVSAVERALVQRHFLGKTVTQLEEDLRVYGKSLAADFGYLSSSSLAYYLPAAQAYLNSEFADGDWDFAHGLVGALAAQVRGGALSPGVRVSVWGLVRDVRDHAVRFQIEAKQQPFAGWVAELTEK